MVPETQLGLVIASDNEFDDDVQHDLQILKQAWADMAEGGHFTPYISKQQKKMNKRLASRQKLKRLKPALKHWNKQVFGNVDTNVKLAVDEVMRIQELIDKNGVTDNLQALDYNAQLILTKALLGQDQFWNEKTRLVSLEDNVILTKVPSAIDVDAVFTSVQSFFLTGKLPHNLNSNLLIVIPKTPGADSIENFRPIALANFQFKIITKTLADRLSVIAQNIISPQQRGFIHDRHISDCVIVASEAINVLHKKRFGGNIALKIDIKKAFDSLDWSFLLTVLHHFGFNSAFC
ncbi:RNA-directed DNA polymerase (Reverse transcriptase), partial [Trifolium medium]|nr:RNA-directed DNA polymerase (Reverse transcriptase) [Trifolium medium]